MYVCDVIIKQSNIRLGKRIAEMNSKKMVK